MQLAEHPPVVLIGPGGWIGSAFLATLADHFGPGWPARTRVFGSRERRLRAADGTEVPVRLLADLSAADVADALVLHLAYLTKEKAETAGVRSFLDTNLAIDGKVMTAITAGTPAGLFVASSGAARLAECGVDRHPYGMAKLMQEDAFGVFAARSSVPALIGRIYNIAGPFINKLESYAISSFLTQAIKHHRICIAASVPVYRSYLHVLDLCELVLRTLTDKIAYARPVDLCGPLVVEMEQVAAAAARVTGLARDAIVRPPVDATRPSIYLGDATQTLGLAQSAGMVLKSFEKQVADTARYLRSRRT